ncbi:MAG: 4-hydroxythreonine-4-phosphate dehydrogenase PdxA [Balneolaceae bacterium]
MPLKIAISMGDPNGIGPEIILKTIKQRGSEEMLSVIFGHFDLIKHTASLLNESPEVQQINHPDEAKTGMANVINCIDAKLTSFSPGSISANGGAASMQAVSAGIESCLKNETDALVTAPISKESITLAGYNVPGHTEFLAEKTGAGQVLMMLVSGAFRVALATIHIPVRLIPQDLTHDLILTRLKLLHSALKNDFGISQPKIAVLGLNPHAGDGGVIGDEEMTLIGPVLNKLQTKDVDVKGPFAADAFFGNSRQNNFDAVFAMYHDQGLIPFKALTFGSGVNVTAGLPIVRTSPDHGTAFDIAGKNLADCSSFSAAFSLAAKMAENKQ